MFRLGRLTSIWILYVLFLVSCSEKPNQDTKQDLSYFDLKGYFEGEAKKFDEQNPRVFKEVYRNNLREAKEVTINDWQKEFSLFIESDINKPSWKNSYSSKKSGDTILYNAIHDDLRTKRVKIVKSGAKVRFLSIENSATNELYQSDESLVYYPDSLYKITKKQRVRVLGENSYEVVGEIKKAN